MQANLFRKKALLVEQNALHCILYKEALDLAGFDTYVASSPMDALMNLKNEEQDLLIFNAEMADEKFLNKYMNNLKESKNGKGLPIIGISLYSKEKRKNILKFFDIFLTKPFSIDTLLQAIESYTDTQNGSQSSDC